MYGTLIQRLLLPVDILIVCVICRHEFEWRREECYILRKPDPAVLVAVTKEPPGRLRTSTVQILDYNLNRYVPNIFCLFKTNLRISMQFRHK